MKSETKMTAATDALDAAVDRVLAQRRVHVVGRINLERRAQRILEHCREFLRLFLREMAGDLAPVVNLAVDVRRGIKLAIQDDGQPMADVVARDFAKPFSGGVREFKFDDRLAQIAAPHPRALDDVAGETRFGLFLHDDDFGRRLLAILRRLDVLEQLVARRNRLVVVR